MVDTVSVTATDDRRGVRGGDRLRWVSVAAGSLVVLLGLLVIVGWIVRSTTLIQVLPWLTPMQFNTALAFVFSGAALILSTLGRVRSAAVVAAPAGLLGLFTLIEYATGVSLGIDELFMKAYVTIGTPDPGRMAPNTALCFVLAAVVVGLGALRPRGAAVAFIRGTLATLLLALGAAALAGYLAGVHTVFGWGNLTRMAVHTSAGFCVLGAGALACVGRVTPRSAAGIAWLPVAVAICFMAAAVGVWQAQDAASHRQLHRITETTARAVAGEIDSGIGYITGSLGRMAGRWARRGGTPREEWQADAAAHTRQVPGLRVIVWVDPTMHARWVEPLRGNEALRGLDLGAGTDRRAALEAAKAGRSAVVSRPFDLALGGRGVHVYVPIIAGDGFAGYMAAVLDTRAFLTPLLREAGGDFLFRVSGGDRRLLASEGWHAVEPELVETVAARLPGGTTWTIEAMPSESLGGVDLATLGLTLGVGVLLAVLAAVAVHFAQTSHARAVELRRHTDHLEELVAERTVELRCSNAELEQYAWVASHDLQEPLRMISSYTQLLAKRYQGRLDAEADEYIGFAVDGAKRMQALIVDLLVLSRVGSGGSPLTATDSAAVVRTVLTDLTVAIEESGARIVVAGDLPVVRADEIQLGQVFLNLIGNAIEYRGEAAPVVEVSARPAGDEWRFCVADNGVGIEPRYQERVFGLFKKLRPRDVSPGSGMGLTIVRKIVERHGGRVWLEPNAPAGTRACFTIPRAAAEAQAAAGRPAAR